ncbi:MAG: neutral zinc metallopeptidase [Gemmatimonadota bacterium]|nr:neutral zinc metallopeptidase [Gemmatimonadota bacterium]
MVKWRSGRRSTNVEDRRGRRAPTRMGAPIKLTGGMGILVVLAVLLLGGDPLALLDAGGPAPIETSSPAGPVGEDDDAQFISVILASTEDVWGEIFRAAGLDYREPRLVLFTDAVESACGYNSSATGPFYCPPDEQIYIDLGFFRELARMGGPGDFARAYVLGHEVGHHIQNLTGINEDVRRRQQAAGSQADANALQVRMELQADCLAGVWAHHANRMRDILEPGDVEEGLAAAEAIGDDRLMRSAGRRVSPESFTHGTSAQRRDWLARGLREGDPDGCDTFAQ